MKKNRVLITAGGTGGHIYPAVGLAGQLTGCDVLFAGGKLGTNRFFADSGFPYQEISCATLPFSQPWKLPLNAWKIASGIRDGLKVLEQFQPQVVVGFGSFYTLPMLLAAKIKGVPIVLHEQNRPLGKVNRLFAPYVDAVCVHFPDTLSKTSLQVVGLPLRPGFQKGSMAKEQACARYGFDSGKLTLLAFGGSQGAKKLNETFQEAVILLKDKLPPFQVLHFTGPNEGAIRERYQQAGIQAYTAPFEPRIEYAWQAADAVVCRSGAGTVAEQIEFEVPGVLVPYPYATDQHQDHNADFVVEKVKLGVKMRESQMTPQNLAEALQAQIEHRDLLRRNAQDYKKTRAHKEFKEIVLTIANR
jgi:UDP-N-acetylglucosamine--N-acetylmuramyl-(pentapeptide) pyrophosphoryl-undecaprenol N-acetylglucosamine transferase